MKKRSRSRAAAGLGASLNLLNPTILTQLRQAVNQAGEPKKSSLRATSTGSGVSVQVLSNSGPITASAPKQGTASAPSLQGTQISQVYTYKVKIICPVKKSDAVVRHLNHFTSKFVSVTALRIQLMSSEIMSLLLLTLMLAILKTTSNQKFGWLLQKT